MKNWKAVMIKYNIKDIPFDNISTLNNELSKLKVKDLIHMREYARGIMTVYYSTEI
jgi:hypothetical protein